MPQATLRQKRSRATRQLILDTAYQQFAAHGFGQTSIEAVLENASISKGAFYHHFDSKEALFNALLEEHVRKCADDTAAAVANAPNLREAITALVHASLEAYSRDPAWKRLSMEFWVQATRDPFSREIVARSMAQCRATTEQALREGQRRGVVRSDLDPAQAAAVFVAMFDGLAVQAAVDADSVNLVDFAGTLADLIQRFIESPNGGTS